MAKYVRKMDTQAALRAVLATDNEEYSSSEDSIDESDTEYAIPSMMLARPWVTIVVGRISGGQ